MKGLAIAFALIVAAVQFGFGQNPRLSANDLKVLEGGRWTGTLTYLDYSSNKRTSIKSDLVVTRIEGESAKWMFSYEYPDEPKANSSSTVGITDDGRVFDGKQVTEITGTTAGTFRLVTTKEGTDNDKKALFRYTYFISRSSFSITKEVQLEGSNEWFERNTYSWLR